MKNLHTHGLTLTIVADQSACFVVCVFAQVWVSARVFGGVHAHAD